ncbi:hypothetical protein Rrhod_4394 [Rhodococcus rhodnii LMG 5362]|uniref:Uncharacterized protein n=1 Tax=Rhodococcus rhodnii LMG 5362 TaxID=1273125 RepID=R7WGT6_9NOCA|nr:hypothetical protein Rrhod_4394 [Rhodococcus rhodnii LMG 5362]
MRSKRATMPIGVSFHSPGHLRAVLSSAIVSFRTAV